MVQRWVVGMIVSFIMRQLAKWQEEIDWEKVESDLEERIRALVPGTWFDDEVVLAMQTLLAVIRTVLSSSAALQDILGRLANKDWQGAWSELRQLILDSWDPATEADKIMYAYVSDLETVV